MSKPMSPDDPAYWMLFDGHETIPDPDIYEVTCSICRDPEFAQMGLPLCRPCEICGDHVAADDCVCKHGHMQAQDPFDMYVNCLVFGLPFKRELKMEAHQIICLDEGQSFIEKCEDAIEHTLEKWCIGVNIDGVLIEKED